MSDKQNTGETSTSRVRRRGLIAGAAALVAATLVKRDTHDVAAQGEPLIVGNGASTTPYQVATATTWLASAPIANGPTFRVTNGFPSAPDATGDGMQGFTTKANNAGVFGRNNDTDGVGVWGEEPSGTGVFGDSSNGSGVAGNSASRYGVYGQSASGVAVYGVTQNGGSATGTIGVYGANLTNSADAHGIVGLSTHGHGLVGTSSAASNLLAGLVGQGANGASAGNFFGNVAVTGNLFVGGSQTVAGAKSAALAHPDGSRRLVYCVEAPESWLEDFGTGTLVNGTADVKFDPEFAAVVDMKDYHVFLTGYDDHTNLIVKNRQASGFTVAADTALASLKGKKASDLTSTFSYRVVVRRKDVKAQRLAKFTAPNLVAPNLDVKTTPRPATVPAQRPR